MVDNQIRTFDVTDQRVLAAFEAVPRELFLPDRFIDLAYSDAILSTTCEGGQRPQLVPMVLARMLQGLELEPDDRTLVIAPGTGYAAALVAELCGSVVALESEPGFVQAITANMNTLGFDGIEAVLGSLPQGYAARQPYTAMLVCGAVERDLDLLCGQLSPGGRIVAIQTASHEATRRSGKVVRFERIGDDISSRVLFDATAPVLDAFRQEPAFTF